MKNYISTQGFVSISDTDDLIYIQQNTQLTGSLSVSGGITFGGNVPLKNSKGPYYVVGNALSGDTLNDCDYLDTGDGVQLQAALNLISLGTGTPAVRPDVYLRPGRITANSTIAVPIQGILRGAGGFASGIQNTSTNRTALTCGLRSIIDDIYVTAVAPVIGCSGSELMSFVGPTRIHRLRAVVPVQVVGVATNESITAVVRQLTASSPFGAQLIDCQIDGYSYRRLGLARDMVGLEIFQPSTLRNFAKVSNLYVSACDINIDAKGPVLLSGIDSHNSARVGISSSTYSDGRLSPIINNSYVHTTDLAGTAQYGIMVDTGANASGLLGADISNVTVTTTSTNTGSIGIRLIGNGTAARINNNFVDSFVTAMTASATQTNINASGNTIRNFTNGILIQSSGSLVSNTVTV